MNTTTMTRARLGMLPIALLALLAAGCGTHRSGDRIGADGSSRPASATPDPLADFPCPGESRTPTAPPPAGTPEQAGPPTDHYAENNGFKFPLPLHGQRRCEGLAAVGGIKKALEPLRTRGDFSPGSTRGALNRLGYSTGQVRVRQDGPTGVGFLIDTSHMCVEGTMTQASTEADAFAGYPDHSGCDVPSGGH
ncbi:hypothetical protein [Streptomyces orinoci]|uniref:Lipoprotein n=1 Tax=Streptomyces orinoci TaxID=67339 RepID=A0ABV3JZ13_STRON|nr:hypothetical protein [Streptomyces orinoci]